MTGSDGARVRCPRCGANNFPGQAACWQCGSSLPPPEEIGAAPAAGRAAPPLAPHAARSPTGPWLLALPIALALVGLLGFLLTRAHRLAYSPSAGRASAQLRELDARNERMQRGGSGAVSDPSALDPDSEEARARRELERLKREYNLADPPADAAGQVRLRGGGTISREEWERARRRLNETP